MGRVKAIQFLREALASSGDKLRHHPEMAQIEAKRRITADKIVIEVRNAYVAMQTAYARVLQTREAVAFANDLAMREARNEEQGLSDMLKVSLREQYAVESGEKEVEAQLQYHQARADYRAALALDRVGPSP